VAVYSDPTLEVQKAIHDVLEASPFQTECGVTVGVCDHVDAKTPLPYVVISDIQCDGAAAQAYDASDVIANLNIFSNKPGKVELFRIANAVRAYLAPRSNTGAPFAMTHHRLITWRHRQTVPKNEPDGISTSAVVSIEFNTEPL
jgi:hypothetical protein